MMEQKPQDMLLKAIGFFVLGSQHPSYPSRAPIIEHMTIPLPQTLGMG